MIYSIDLAIFRYLNSWAGVSPFFDGAIRFRARYLLWVMIGAILFFIIVPLVPTYRRWLKENLRMAALAFCGALIARFGITEFIRLVYPRPRPFEVLPDVAQLLPHPTGGAFPSGHAALSFAIAAAIACYYPKTSVLFFLAALSIGVSRIAAGVHWPSDVFGGMIVGVVSVFGVSFLVRKRKIFG